MIRHHFLLIITLSALSPLASGPTAHAQTKAEQIDALLTQYHDYGLFNGAVLVAEKSEIIYKQGFGYADMAWDVPNTPDTKFRIGSVTKQFTAALILQLVEEGKIDLHKTISTYLPDYPKPQGERVTIHHLLTHTSGIPNYTALPGFMSNEVRDPYAPDSFLTVFSSLDLEFEPGTRWSYSNSGYSVLGAIIESVTGQSYDKVLRKRILEPLGLDNTGYDHYAEIIERRARGYVKTPAGYQRAPYLDTSVPYAAGMVYSTVEDLFEWDQQLYGNGPFEKAGTKELLFTPYAALPESMAFQRVMPASYGYGWFAGDVPIAGDSVEVIAHSGGIFGFITGFWRMPEEQNTIIIIDNTSSGNVYEIGRGLMHILYDKPATEPKQPVSKVLAEVIAAEGAEAAVAHYHKLKENAPDTYSFSEHELNRLGYYYLSKGDTGTAIRLFQLNVEAYPESANTYDSLGEAYMKADNRELAIQNYRKALELNPGSENAKRMLGRLGIEVEDAIVEVPEEMLASYVGRYKLRPGFVLTITLEGDQLHAQATGQPRVEIFPMAENEFYLKVADAQLTFKRNKAGEVESLVLHQNGRDIPAPKIQ